MTMPHKAINKLGELERAVMDTVWQAQAEGRSPVSVRTVHDELSRSRDLAYTTVMTVMGRLADSGLLTQERSGRAYLYAAADSREELTATTMREHLSGMATADRRAAMLHFLGDATVEEIADLKAALAEVEQRHTTGAPAQSPARGTES
jgi:predicted transcriptional regulator